MLLVSYVICTYNRERFLPIAIASWVQQYGLDWDEAELIIVDNNSTDDTPGVVKRFQQHYPNLRIIYTTEEKQGLSNARNKGIETATADWIAFLDDDAYVDQYYHTNLVSFIKRNADTYKAIGGPILLDFEEKPPRWYTPYLGSLFGYFKPYRHSRDFGEGFYPRGSNMIFHRSLFEKYGNFNPLLGRIGKNMLGSEEKEMFQRIYQGNEKVYYLSSLIMYHLVPEFRTSIDFVKRQAIGVGYSEHFRIQLEKHGLFKKILSECFKWLASIVLLLFYTVQLSPSKGIMLLRFRYWVLKGLLSKNIE